VPSFFLPKLEGEQKTLARKQNKGTELSVFKGREARLNHAIFETLATDGPRSISTLQKQLNKQKDLSRTYYASLTKRIHTLQDSGYIKETAKREKGSKAVVYELRMKAYLASFLNSNSLEDILNQATDVEAAFILLTLLKAALPDKEN
jgi:DNA-binding PadR family transcriptional regulator